MKRPKPPKEGDRVVIKRNYPADCEPVDALVDWVGATQFACDGADGVRYMVNFVGSTEWRICT